VQARGTDGKRLLLGERGWQQRLRKPSQIVCDLQAGEGISESIPKSVMPGSLAEEAEEAGGAWVTTDGVPVLLEDFEGLEYVFTAETADSEGLEP